MARQDGGLERRFASRTKFHGRNDLSSLLSKINFRRASSNVYCIVIDAMISKFTYPNNT